MPSPFPGMDPYLEDPAVWPDIHLRLLSAISASLNRTIRPKYFTRVETRVYISDDSDPGRDFIVPDTRVMLHLPEAPPPRRDPSGPSLIIAPSILVDGIPQEQVDERFLELVHRESGQLVSVIELLSPANKVGGARGRESFQAKRGEVLQSQSHWVEIDLLRRGDDTFQRPSSLVCDYAVCYSRVEQRPRYRVWLWRLQDPLPVIGIPLKGNDPDAPLDLGAMLATAYDDGAYDLTIDYRRDPNPELDAQQAVWADALLKEKGLR